MYYEDFSKYGNTEGAVVYGVGWLDVAKPFNIGDTDISIVNKLGAILNIQRINLMRGIISVLSAAIKKIYIAWVIIGYWVFLKFGFPMRPGQKYMPCPPWLFIT